MAMLHEKEIVLNKYDTANLLSAIDLVRQFESSLASMKWGLGALTAVNQLHHNYSDTLEQNVTIHAEFPNATDHREIEEAFGNLVNLASQYAQRK
jgi:hypothetical protein